MTRATRPGAAVRRAVVPAVVAVALAGCASSDTGQQPSEAHTSTPATAPSPTDPTSDLEVQPTRDDHPTSPDEGIPSMPADTPPTGGSLTTLQAAVLVAQSDVADRTGNATPPEVLVAEEVTFPDGSLGCPEAGEAVTQAQVEGYRILLSRGDRAWLYTAAAGDPPELCPSGEADGGRDFVPTDPED